jgi:hypothetical protein
MRNTCNIPMKNLKQLKHTLATNVSHNISLLLAARRERIYARSAAVPSHHAVAIQDHPRAGRPSAQTTQKDIYARRGRRRIKATGITWCYNITGGLRGYVRLGQKSSSTTRRRRRTVPWGGVGSNKRGNHIWHQSKARTTQGPRV